MRFKESFRYIADADFLLLPWFLFSILFFAALYFFLSSVIALVVLACLDLYPEIFESLQKNHSIVLVIYYSIVTFLVHLKIIRICRKTRERIGRSDMLNFLLYVPIINILFVASIITSYTIEKLCFKIKTLNGI